MTEREVFEAALELAPGDRIAFLDRACAGDAGLRQRLTALLGNHDRAGAFLEEPVVRGVFPADAGPDDMGPQAEAIGQVLGGRYQLLEAVREGGMGTVWMAQQTEPIKRLVAVKVIKAGMGSKAVLARFEAERQALALMDHPNIARVLDAGATPDGRPFFVMELVRGVPITRHSDESRLTPRQRLELFIPVCQAVQHAHQKGIIHRDLKPSNVLVALYDRPVPKVIDFGVAKATGQQLTEETLHTGFGTVVGTVEYMSPEQASFGRLDVDTRSDVYALGVLLYELLAGGPPFGREGLAKAGLLEALRVIREQEPPRPSTRLSTAEGLPTLAANRGTEPKRLAAQVRGELDWIVMKCLEKDRDRRYDTANALALDVQRYLADEPVLAGPPSAWYRFRKFARRNKRALGAVTAFAVILVVATVVSIGLAAWALRADSATHRALQRVTDAQGQTLAALGQVTSAQQKTQLALKNETAARKKTRQSLARISDRVFEETFARKVQLAETDKQFLREILADYEAFAAEKGDSVEARELRAEGQFRVGLLRNGLGELADAEDGYRAALKLYVRLAADFPAVPQYRQQVASSHNNLGNVLDATGRSKGAETARRAALKIYTELAAEFPTESEYRQHLATCHNNLAELLNKTGRAKDAEVGHRTALEMRNKLAADSPTVPQYRSQLAMSHRNLGNLLYDTGRLKDAEAAYRAGLEIQTRLAADFPAVPAYRQDLASSHINLAVLLSETGRSKDAEATQRAALEILSRLAADFPTVPYYRGQLALSHYNLGNLLKETGRPKDAEAAYRAALEIRNKLAADFPTVPDYRRQLANSHNNLAVLLKDTGRLKDAEAGHRAALEIRSKLAADFPSVHEHRQDLAGSHYNLAAVLGATGRPKEAEAGHRAALEIRNKLAADFPTVRQYRRQLADSHNSLAALLRATGRPKEAEADHRAALAVLSQLAADFPTVPAYQKELAAMHYFLGGLLRASGRPEEAEAADRAALAVRSKLVADFPAVPAYRRELAGTYYDLGGLLRATGRLDESITAYRQALAGYEKLVTMPPGLAKDHSWLALTLHDLAQLLVGRSQPSEGCQLLERATVHQRVAVRMNPQDANFQRYLRNHYQALADAYAKLGKHQESAKAALQLPQVRPAVWQEWHHAARYLGSCVLLAGKDARLSEAERKEVTQGYGDQALKMLRQAVALGYRNAGDLKQEPAFAPLRAREDFQKLVAELEASKL